MSGLTTDNAESIGHYLQYLIKEDIYSEVVETMKDDFDPEKASEICTLNTYDREYPDLY